MIIGYYGTTGFSFLSSKKMKNNKKTAIAIIDGIIQIIFQSNPVAGTL